MTRVPRCAFLALMTTDAQPNVPIELIPEPGDLPTDAAIYKALIRWGGNIGEVAQEFDLPRHLIARRVALVPILMETCTDFRENLVDLAEAKLQGLVQANDGPSVRFALQTLGKARGYSSGVAGTGKGGSIVVEIRQFEETPDASSS